MTLPSIARASVIVLLGDHRQFQAVAYGDALGKAQAIEPGVDMQTTMRQKTEWQARATEELREGRIRAGLDAYNRNALIHQRPKPKPAPGSSQSGRRSSAGA